MRPGRAARPSGLRRNPKRKTDGPAARPFLRTFESLGDPGIVSAPGPSAG
jgi:hypothetical protein